MHTLFSYLQSWKLYICIGLGQITLYYHTNNDFYFYFDLQRFFVEIWIGIYIQIIQSKYAKNRILYCNAIKWSLQLHLYIAAQIKQCRLSKIFHIQIDQEKQKIRSKINYTSKIWTPWFFFQFPFSFLLWRSSGFIAVACLYLIHICTHNSSHFSIADWIRWPYSLQKCDITVWFSMLLVFI